MISDQAPPERPRVIEVGSGVSSAFCGALFKRWGWDVIRVEPSSGTSRAVATADDPFQREWLDIYLNHGKRRVSVDCANPEGLELLQSMIGQCDVLLSDCDPSEVEAFQLLETRPGERTAVRTSITPFGLSGPYRDWQATSATLLALGGQTHLMGDRGRAPLTMPGRYPEYQSALFAYSATMAAFLYPERDTPRVVEVSMFEAMVTLHQSTTVQFTYGGQVRSRNGNRFGAMHPLTILPCREGWFGMCIGDNFWESFTFLLGRPELSGDPQFNSGVLRGQNADALDEIIIAATSDRTKNQIMHEGQETWRVPVGIVASLDDMLSDEHLAARDFWRPLVTEGHSVRIPGPPYRFAGDVVGTADSNP